MMMINEKDDDKLFTLESVVSSYLYNSTEGRISHTTIVAFMPTHIYLTMLSKLAGAPGYFIKDCPMNLH